MTTHQTQARRLTADEEAQLIHNYTALQDKRALDKLVSAHLPLVEAYARRAWRRAPRLDLDDLVQEGVVGLLKGLQKYEPGHGARFSTYASWWVKLSIRSFVTQNGRSTQMPKCNVTNRLVARLRATRGRREAAGLPTDPEALAAALGVTPEVIIAYDSWLAERGEVRLNAPLQRALRDGDREATLLDYLPGYEDVGEVIEEGEARRRLAEEAAVFGRGLSAVERQVFELRLLSPVEPPSLTEVGATVGRSRQRVAQIEWELRGRFLRHLRGAGLAPG